MRIRPFELTDAETVSKLIVKTLFKINTKDYSLETLSVVASMYTVDNLIAYSKRRTMLVAEEGQRIIGTGSLEGDTICGLFASHDQQSRGVGRAVMNQLELIAKEQGKLVVKLSASLTASKFYEKLGYNFVERIETPYGVNIVMTKSL